MPRTSFLFTLAVLCLVSSLPAQEPASAEKTLPESLKLQLEFQTQRAELLKTRLQLMKESHEVAVHQAKLRINSRKTEQESLQDEIKIAEAQMKVAKIKLDNAEKLYERQVVSHTTVELARQAWVQAEFEHKKAQTANKNKGQEVDAGKLELKQIELQGSIQINEVQLELLEGEFRIKELKLALQKE